MRRRLRSGRGGRFSRRRASGQHQPGGGLQRGAGPRRQVGARPLDRGGTGIYVAGGILERRMRRAGGRVLHRSGAVLLCQRRPAALPAGKGRTYGGGPGGHAAPPHERRARPRSQKRGPLAGRDPGKGLGLQRGGPLSERLGYARGAGSVPQGASVRGQARRRRDL